MHRLCQIFLLCFAYCSDMNAFNKSFSRIKKGLYILVPFQWVLLDDSEDVAFPDHLKKGLGL